MYTKLFVQRHMILFSSLSPRRLISCHLSLFSWYRPQCSKVIKFNQITTVICMLMVDWYLQKSGRKRITRQWRLFGVWRKPGINYWWKKKVLTEKTYADCKLVTIFFERAKLAHLLNWHQRESNLKPQERAHSQISNQYHHANPSGLTNY